MVQLTKFGKYEIVRKLGRSMTDVYLAHDPESGRPAVLKIIEESRDEYTQLVMEAERRGAQIQAQLHHLDPRILEIYEYGEQDGCFFVAMAYFEGRNIADILRTERRLEPLRAVRYAAEICSQLDRLHSFVSDVSGQKRAVVHGDIKPSNIQIGPNDEVRLLDFGISKVITYTHNLTHHNLGSPTYCSPERLSKAQVDPQSDLWALGVSLYEMVSGAPPYQAQDTRKLENLIQSKRPPRAVPASCPPSVRAVIAKALAPDIRRRYATAAAFESDLRAILLNLRTSAENEKQGTWAANATILKPPEPARPTKGRSTRWPSFHLKFPRLRFSPKERGVWWALGAGMLCGLFFVPLHFFYTFWNESKPLQNPDFSRASISQVHQSWNLYQKLQRQDAFLGSFSPAATLTIPLRSALLTAANDIIEGYRNSSNSSIHDFDWKKARLCLRYALQMSPGNREIRGKLALCEGYATLIASPKLPGAAQSEQSFLTAASALPRSPDPHLALARVYTYSFGNVGKAAAEFSQAERLGYRNGPRELEAQGDGYLARAEYELRQAKRAAPLSQNDANRWLAAARSDLDRARTLYEPIAGFSRVNANLEQLYQDRTVEQKLTEGLADAAKLKAKKKTARPKKSSPHRKIWAKRESAWQ